jgi:tRNA(adenine34) deaminase
MSEERDDNYWMTRALELAQKSRALGEVPVGAVVVSNDELLGEGWNQPIASSDPTAHAEIVALRDAAARLGNYRLVGTTLYVTIEPCTMCTGALVHARISRLVYGAREPRAGAVASNAQVLTNTGLNHRFEITEGVCKELCSDLVSSFFRHKRASAN